MKLQTKEEIKDWLDKYEVKNYTIKEDLTVDVNWSVNLLLLQLKFPPTLFGLNSKLINSL